MKRQRSDSLPDLNKKKKPEISKIRNEKRIITTDSYEIKKIIRIYFLNPITLGAGEMAQGLRALSVLQKNWVQFLAFMWQLLSATPIPRDPTPTSGLCRHHVHTQDKN